MAQISGLRDFIAQAERLGQTKTISGAAADLEVGAITEVAREAKVIPLMIFDKIVGTSSDYRVVTNLLDSPERENIIYGLPADLDDRTALATWKDRIKEMTPLPPRQVSDGPITHRVVSGGAVDLDELPFLRWHELDGGSYACATATVTRDPESGYINVGSYRFMRIGKQKLVYHIGSGHHGDVIRRKWWEQGKACPVAICLGEDPCLFIAAGTNLRYGFDEYGYAGWLRGAPVDVLEGPVTGLPIPADAEVVLEGEMLPPKEGEELEGPFGEASGYYGGGAHPSPVLVVKSVMTRKDPIVLGRPPHQGTSRERLGSRAVQVWTELDDLGVPGVTAVNYQWGLAIISVRQLYPGHAMRAAHGALGGTAGYHARVMIVVDEDVDVYRPEEVLWAIATRCDPETSIDIARRMWSYRIDPRLSPEKRGKGDYSGSAVIIDACRPYYWRDKFPPVSAISASLRQKTLDKWAKSLR